ncbi:MULTISPECIES: type II toxin-antitoxin system PemK/MazF family toxin [Arthrobacter]|uniref:Type II toxin-antitoxin system PemK/MazF family toxin n=1 Tax=Arthrobacter terricola TaxID=2547396 RepID=A0A4R5KEI7_9MICC|nr:MULTISPECIES: type II toxin-antitoxin system PemK/MazF family toxin [Arthrobacter]MBT8162373.1 type II toxin-antitoxin system PemK/MazF family toxin [Arthrobacter sp. GN70]TDF93372.1 type II toxin-antitoxin system PemK/MazF family toxin [Arthrobacter terricola]
MASNKSLLGRLLKGSLGYLRRIAGSPAGTRPATKPGQVAGTGVGHGTRPYPGDFRGRVSPSYSPRPDGKPDPGEIVWSWVPYEEDYSQGKDRPVLLIGHDGGWLLGLMLTSKDHDNGRHADDYVDIGAGPWDPRGRASEVKIDRVIRLDPSSVRREGAVLDKRTFQLVARGLGARHDPA